MNWTGNFTVFAVWQVWMVWFSERDCITIPHKQRRNTFECRKYGVCKLKRLLYRVISRREFLQEDFMVIAILAGLTYLLYVYILRYCVRGRHKL